MRGFIRTLGRYLPVILLLVGLSGALYGVLVLKENRIVFGKATRVCMECIGIG